MAEVITDNLDLWTSALLTKSSAGRGSNGRLEAYGIKKLRELILELAVRGKLLPQDSNDESASELLDRIKYEKRQLIQNGEIREKGLTAPIPDKERPFDEPPGWKWARLSEITRRIHYGYTASAKAEIQSVRLLRITDIQDNTVDWRSVPGCEIDELILPQYRLDAGDILVARTGGTVGKTYLVSEIPVVAVFASYLIRIQGVSALFVRYLKLFLESPTYWVQLVEGARGGAQPNVNGRTLGKMMVPLPPEPEQHRIVAKVDELMALCDQLEQQQTHSLEAHQTLVETLLGTLTRAASHQELTEAWARIADHFDTLFTTEHSIDQLKQTILQLAVMGKLVPQDPSDKPAGALLEKITAERDRLVRKGKIKKQKETPLLNGVEKPFNLPEGWQWVSLSQLGVFSGGKTPSKMKGMYWDGNIPWVTPKDMKVPYIYDTEDHVTDAAINDGLAAYEPESVLFVVRSGILRRAFPVAIAKVKCTVNQDLKVLSLYKKELSSYIHIMMKGFEQYILENLTKTGMTVESVLFDEFSTHFFMLPPLDEQHRIVAKVDELMALCDALEARIKDAQTTQLHLADAIVEQAVA